MQNNYKENKYDQNQVKAVELIRQKVSKIYQSSPSAIEEEKISEALPNNSPHQEFIRNLTNSGENIASIQTKWHEYYLSLPDKEKFEVWQEFYESSKTRVNPKTKETSVNNLSDQKTEILSQRQSSLEKFSKQVNNRINNQRTIKENIIQNANSTKTRKSKLGFKNHLKSLIFGLSFGGLTIFIFLFSFFNQIIITPFLQPSNVSAATPLIITNSNIAPSNNPEVIIPKINVQIPVNYTETSNSESAIENDLQNGVVHYPSTVMPGQIGNSAYFGHSSNNILNPGKYKFAFVLLHTLVNGDTFYLTYNGTVYVYKVISHQIVSPTDVSVLGPVAGQTSTATLITCDPPGTSINRLVVVGQQISPNPVNNTAPTVSQVSYQNPTTLPGNGPSLFNRVFQSTTNRIIGIVASIIFLLLTIKWIYSFKN